MKCLALVALLALPLHAEDLRAWRWSVATFGTASTADAISSYGKWEGNALLGQKFDFRSVAIKGSLFSAVIVAEGSMVRRHPRAAKALTIVNYGLAGLYAGVAVHNTRIGRAR